MTWQVCFVSLSAYGYFNPEAPLGGGAQRQLSLLGRELADEFEVSFVVGDYGQPVRERRDSITFYRAYRPDADTSTVSQLTRLWQLRRAMGQADADIYVYRGRPWKAAFTYLLATSLGKPYVYNLANDPNVSTSQSL